MPSIYDWSITAASNATADADINWAEGQAPSTVNGSARQMMARLREFVTDLGGVNAATGTANALTVTARSAFTTNVNGRMVSFRAASDNTGAATLNVNGIGAKSIRKMLSTGESALVGAEIQATGIYLVQYSQDLDAAAGGWLLLNPTGADPTSFVTLTGSQTLTNKLFTTGNAFNGTLGATTPASVAGTTGTFSGAISGTTGTFSGVIVGSSSVTSSQTFASSTTNVVLGTVSAGTVLLRPNGTASSTGQMTVTSTGAATIDGTLAVGDQAIFSVGAAEIARTSSTSVIIGKTSPNLTAAGTTFFATSTSNGLFQCTRDSDIVGQFNVINPVGTETVLEFMTSGTAKGSITINGSTTAYNTTSDRRLKENPRSFDAGAIIDRLKVYQFDWKAGGSGYGVFAQEAVKAFPDAVTKGKGKKSWKVDYSKFVPLLIQEVKALREEVRRLKG